MWKEELRPALLMFLVFSVLTGIFYPLGVTGPAQWLFPAQSDGSLIRVEGSVLGSHWIGQPFDDPGYFWGRPSATGPMPYNASASSGSNLGPANPVLKNMVAGRVAKLTAADPENMAPVPVDLVTTSGSGLDPHISPAAAIYQVHRVAKARGLEEEAVKHLVEKTVEARQWGLFGEPRINILELNLALDRIRKKD